MSLWDYEQLASRAVEEARARAQSTGIHSHSSDETYFIFCVGHDLRLVNAFMTWAFSKQISFKALVGMYESQSERSFIANMRDYDQIAPFLHNEESILILNRYDARDVPDALLKDLKTGRIMFMGKLIPVPREKALAEHSWTYDPMDSQYYICKE